MSAMPKPLTGIPLFDNWPKGVAYFISGYGGMEAVTYTQLKAARVEKQRKHFEVMMQPAGYRHAAYLWTFYQPGLFGFAYMGWWAYLWTIKDSWQLSVRDCLSIPLALQVMRQLPCGVLPIPENFEQWKEAFGKTYCRPGRFKRQGLVPGWVECDSFHRPLRWNACEVKPGGTLSSNELLRRI